MQEALSDSDASHISPVKYFAGPTLRKAVPETPIEPEAAANLGGSRRRTPPPIREKNFHQTGQVRDINCNWVKRRSEQV